MFPKTERAIIVGSGPSLRDIAPDDILRCGATVIAVNGAIDWLGKAHFWFTLDPSQVNLVRMYNQVKGCQYVAALPKRYPDIRNVRRLRRIEGELFGLCRAPGKLAEEHDSINTGNSAFGALNLAYHMRPSKIAILGVDASDKRRIDGGMPRSLEHLPLLFESAVGQLSVAGIEVRNGSPDSKVDCFCKVSPKEAIEWLVM